MNKNNFERITMFLRYENRPKTPQEISVWTRISLGEVYDTLQNHKTFFREIIVDGRLEGWIIDYPDLG